MKIDRFEDIYSWRKSGELSLTIYKYFDNSRDYAFRNQICRASVSIMNNIAEGFERNTNKEFKNFLYIAKGSYAEVRSMLYLAFKLKYIDGNQFNDCYFKTIEISKLLSGLIKTL